MRANEFDQTVTCLSDNHLTHWPIISRAMVENIDSENFAVICPDEIFGEVLNLSDPAFRVLKESTFNVDLQNKLRMRIEAQDNLKRYGWYLQQFLKLDFIEQNRSSKHILIWDSDTLPIRQIRFRGSSGKTTFYYGEEYHPEYFRSIQRLTGLEKVVDKSFIAQCFPVEVGVIAPYFDDWKRKSGFWFEAVFDSIDFSQQSGFSEYELLGTIFAHDREHSLQFSDRKWIRNGTELFGEPSGITRRKVADIDFVAFEDWQKSGWVVRLQRSALAVFVAVGRLLRLNQLVGKRLRGSHPT